MLAYDKVTDEEENGIEMGEEIKRGKEADARQNLFSNE